MPRSSLGELIHWQEAETEKGEGGGGEQTVGGGATNQDVDERIWVWPGEKVEVMKGSTSLHRLSLPVSSQ